MSYQDESPPPRFGQAVAEFNARQFFECHETLEDLWNEEERDLRRFYQGILQIGVGYYKIIGKPNYRGALTLLQSGADMLEPFRPQLFGVDVEKLITAARAARQELIELGANNYTKFDAAKIPKIGLV
jgi:uncharacterized protein